MVDKPMFHAPGPYTMRVEQILNTDVAIERVSCRSNRIGSIESDDWHSAMTRENQVERT
jgi:hypothetical protein